MQPGVQSDTVALNSSVDRSIPRSVRPGAVLDLEGDGVLLDLVEKVGARQNNSLSNLEKDLTNTQAHSSNIPLLHFSDP